MIRKKVTKKASKFDELGNLVPCEYEDEEIVVESVGDIIDILSDCSRGASLFMVPPEKGQTIQRVQVWDWRRTCEVREAKSPLDYTGVTLYKGFHFTIGGNGPYSSDTCFEEQLKRERKEGGRKLAHLTWQDMKRIVDISDEIIEKTPMEELNNNGERWFYEEVLKRYKANENGVSV